MDGSARSQRQNWTLRIFRKSVGVVRRYNGNKAEGETFFLRIQIYKEGITTHSGKYRTIFFTLRFNFTVPACQRTRSRRRYDLGFGSGRLP